jgi:hypothetical protein
LDQSPISELVTATFERAGHPDGILHVCTPGYRLKLRVKVAS